jgi:RNA-directed DNA polymerase
VERHKPRQPENREVELRAAGAVGEVRSSQEASNERGAKGPQFKFNAEAARAREIDVSLTTPQTVRQLQRALYAKAKAKPMYRFYALYDKIYRKDVLLWAWSSCRANGGSAGVDGQSFEGIEARGVEGWLEQLAKELKEKTYRPQAVRRVMIPKPDGKQRPLGIPTIKDRVAQTATVIVLEAIFEADLTAEQYAYRPERSAQDAVREVHRLLNQGYKEVVDADLSSYFDTIPHQELMKSMAGRISDGAVLALIKSWLEMAVEEDDGKGGKRRTTVNKDSGRGTPQGAPISPLLANLYMRRFLLGWKQGGWEGKLKARIVNYADDFVILCRGKAESARAVMEKMMEKLKLTVNPKKTRICKVPEESFDFLGYTMGQCYRKRTGQTYLGTKPSKKRVVRICEKITQMTQRQECWKETEDLVGELNLVAKGWANYFCLGSVSQAYRNVDNHLRTRLRQWLCDKHKVQGRGWKRFNDEHLYQKLGLVRLQKLNANLPWANAT